ncbi:hypothetical protein TWF730_006903 [Orbilia blumenaviensis]|uniref:G domain-containing protein n=1 Tax=Orbilia blumenaviensis TaxID=1796055 RepID=A0AAV9VFN5_9PEZI
MVTEAWFFGNRLDLDGTSIKNGLSFWPLQWLVAEARGKGLVLNSDSPSAASTDQENASISELFQFLPQESCEYPFWFSNNVSVNIWDITQVFEVEYHRPEFQTSWIDNFRTKRTVFENDGTLCQYANSDSLRKRTIIHPSVFYHMDQFSCDTSWDCYRKEIEDFRKAEVDTNRSRFFWTTRKILPHKLRIVVCGNEGVGKSSLINSVFNTNKAIVTMEEQTKHNIEEEVVVHKVGGEDSIIIHDSNGFETGDVEKNKEAERFIDKRCNQVDQNEQLHCIWYCIKSDNPRKGDASVQRIFSKCFREWKIPLVIVYTQSLGHEGAIESSIKAKYRQRYGQNARISRDNLISERDKQKAEIRSVQDKWIRETYEGSLHGTTLSDGELADRSTSAYRIQRADIDDHQSLKELVEQTYDIIDPNLWNLFIKGQRVSFDLKARQAIRHGVQVIEGTSFVRVVTRHFGRAKQMKEMAKDILRIFAWDLPGEEVSKVVDYPGDKLFENGYFYTSATATGSGTGLATAAFIMEELALGLAAGSAAGAILFGVGGVSYWALKRNQIRAWTNFLCCFTITSYRAMVKAMQRPIRVGQHHLTAEDFLNEKMTKQEVEELKKDTTEFITMTSCFVFDYVGLQKKIISLTEKFIARQEDL